MNFTVKEILQDALIAHKFLMSMYAQFGLECSNPTLRNLFAELNSVASEHEYKIFTLMKEKNYYPVTAASVKDIKQAVKMHKAMGSELQQKLETKTK